MPWTLRDYLPLHEYRQYYIASGNLSRQESIAEVCLVGMACRIHFILALPELFTLCSVLQRKPSNGSKSRT
ncbi:hypothetical protein BC835DRAFT_1335006 [Cytidiella melzeri]|nr:hypothetical protein BC835DRAFT_1335006 [Cytidiella melzeri]